MPRCGAHSGWKAHHQAGEEVCPLCREFYRLYMRDYMRNYRQKMRQGRVVFPLELTNFPVDGLGLAIARAMRESA